MDVGFAVVIECGCRMWMLSELGLYGWVILRGLWGRRGMGCGYWIFGSGGGIGC